MNDISFKAILSDAPTFGQERQIVIRADRIGLFAGYVLVQLITQNLVELQMCTLAGDKSLQREAVMTHDHHVVASVNA